MCTKTKFQRLLTFCKDRGLNALEFNLEEVHECSVCNALLVVDYHDAYADQETGEVLCDRHSEFDEGTNNYKKILEKDLVL